MIKRAPRQTRLRSRLGKNNQAVSPIITWTASIVATKARVVCNVPVVLAALPLTFTVQNVAPTSITQVNATTFDLGYAANVVATNVLRIGPNDPGVRGVNGGYVASGTVTF